MAKKTKDTLVTFYIVLNYKNSKGQRGNYALLRKKDADLWNEDGDGDGVIEVQSEEIGWMKEAADAACRFREDSDCGSLELGTLFHRIENYEREVYGT